MTATQNAPRTARERARAELSREIKEGARRQLAATGADGISLRAVARELGMASSALYRYYPSRDDLLTALIIDAYDAIGEAAEEAIADEKPDESWGRDRWLAACHAIRGWALDHPHEYALIYGSPVPVTAPRRRRSARLHGCRSRSRACWRPRPRRASSATTPAATRARAPRPTHCRPGWPSRRPRSRRR